MLVTVKPRLTVI
ncbi:hypothetical protein SAMN05660706_103120 [Desulfoscipio geothermicus DSM 3669]|uniref:Uncharacterized protein n=1 Tax=Desulfoscipio geothermicus DSM 3669 TaxID=1121426 RepID=A0A1I6CZQ0_9FIRM|nr:hypothetical protein SAMN05660706_103120 [Desulfoscipio geothermicus DSM 3669]